MNNLNNNLEENNNSYENNNLQENNNSQHNTIKQNTIKQKIISDINNLSVINKDIIKSIENMSENDKNEILYYFIYTYNYLLKNHHY